MPAAEAGRVKGRRETRKFVCFPLKMLVNWGEIYVSTSTWVKNKHKMLRNFVFALFLS